MAKAALNQQTATLAAEFRTQGIKVALAAVHPGKIPTRMSAGVGQVRLDQAARGILEVAEGLEMVSSGRFVDYNGLDLPW